MCGIGVKGPGDRPWVCAGSCVSLYVVGSCLDTVTLVPPHPPRGAHMCAGAWIHTPGPLRSLFKVEQTHKKSGTDVQKQRNRSKKPKAL